MLPPRSSDVLAPLTSTDGVPWKLCEAASALTVLDLRGGGARVVEVLVELRHVEADRRGDRAREVLREPALLLVTLVVVDDERVLPELVLLGGRVGGAVGVLGVRAEDRPVRVHDLRLVRAHELLQHVRDHGRVELAADGAAQVAELLDGDRRIRVADDVARARQARELGLRVRDVLEVRDVDLRRAVRARRQVDADQHGSEDRDGGDRETDHQQPAVGASRLRRSRAAGAARRCLRRGHARAFRSGDREVCGHARVASPHRRMSHEAEF